MSFVEGCIILILIYLYFIVHEIYIYSEKCKYSLFKYSMVIFLIEMKIYYLCLQ